MKINLPAGAENIIRTLEDHGHEAFVVGGCVRDCVLGLKPQDWDITTDAKPLEVKRLFTRTVDTGIKHGTVTVLLPDGAYEVTTFRIDGKYSDGRHPDSVTFTPSLEEDLKRRDFTINAMAYSDSRGLKDLFGGAEDLKAHVIRAVGDPEERFHEDALRMMRAVRFAARFGFEIEDDTLRAISELHELLSKVSYERIRDEFTKTLLTDNPDYIKLMRETGLTHVFMPEWDQMVIPQHTIHHIYNVEDHTMSVLRLTPKDRILRLSAFFHDIGKPVSRTTDKNGTDHFKHHPERGALITADVMRRLRFDRDTIKKCVNLVRWHDLRPDDSDEAVRKAVSEIGTGAFPDLFILKRADILSQSTYKRAEKLAEIDMFERRYNEIISRHDPLSIGDLEISGKDIMELGVNKGPVIGRILSGLLSMAIKDPSVNTHDKLLDLASAMIESGI
jgi:tRNA nucleotidyltransferase (CCA-adding enzyme)